MTTNKSFFNELKTLGSELSHAIQEARKSKEFKNLERELIRSAKSISEKLGKAVEAAKKSEKTKKVKGQFKRVVKTGKKQGLQEAKKAQAAATRQIAKASEAIEALTKKLK